MMIQKGTWARSIVWLLMLCALGPVTASAAIKLKNESERKRAPEFELKDREGKIVKKIVGFSPTIQKELDAAVEQALK